MAANNKDEQNKIINENEEANQQDEVFKQFSMRKILWPILIGFAVIIYMNRDFDPEKLKQIELTTNAAFWFLMCLVAMIIRHIFFMWRLKILTDDEFSWKQCFQVITIWEFASTATPSAVGGTAVALPLISKEGVTIGRTTTIVFITMVLDGLFFIIFIGGLWIFLGEQLLSSNIYVEGAKQANWAYGFFAGFSITVGYSLLITYGLFINPSPIRWLFEKIFSLPFIRRWRDVGKKAGQDLVIASAELRSKKMSYWINSFIATAGAWSCRFMVVNFVLLTITTNFNQILVFTRSAVVFLVMALVPTPGSAGAAEYSFTSVLEPFIPNAAEPALALVWRIFTYYIFLPLGFIVLPIWLRRVFKKEER